MQTPLELQDRLSAWVAKQNSLGRYGQAIHPLPSRLMENSEQPAWIQESSWNSKNMHGVVSNANTTHTVEDLSMGRKRKEVTYDDGLTDDQYCRSLEQRADDEEMQRKRARQEEQGKSLLMYI